MAQPVAQRELERGFDEAVHHLQQGRWHDAFVALAALADNGHRPAARLALLFVERGTRLFGSRYQATPAQRDAWRRLNG